MMGNWRNAGRKKKIASIVLLSMLGAVGIAVVSSWVFIRCVGYHYIPRGEIYQKSPAALGCDGDSCVVDLEIEKTLYQFDGDETLEIPMTVGIGHLPTSSSGGESAKLAIKVVDESSNEEFDKTRERWSYELPEDENVVFTKEYDYDSFGAEFNSSWPARYPLLLIPIYDDFYPLYHERLTLEIPAGIEKGQVYVILTVNESYSNIVALKFKIEEGNLVFYTNPHFDNPPF